MIKLGMRDSERMTIVLGLSRSNCERLLTGDPIIVSMDELRMGRGTIMIMAGETEEDIIEDLRSIGVIDNELVRKAHANGGIFRGGRLFNDSPDDQPSDQSGE